ncbi:MAG: DUF2147 domain-containing protein [Chitinophagales bacterium]|nr:DUF2147 domain-containing protein [Chitinophagales bacterium]
MKKMLLLLLVIGFMASDLAAQNIFGRWWTKDKKSIVYIYPCENGICGKLEEIVKPDKPEDIRFKGFVVLRNFKKRSQKEWVEGQIWDPRTNKDYSGKLVLEGNQLYVRGFVGIELLGQTQTWERVQ